jgi:hypothetical protein
LDPKVRGGWIKMYNEELPSPEFFLEREMFQTKVVEKVETHILYSVTFFPKIVPLMRCVKIWYSQTGHS